MMNVRQNPVNRSAIANAYQLLLRNPTEPIGDNVPVSRTHTSQAPSKYRLIFWPRQLSQYKPSS